MTHIVASLKFLAVLFVGYFISFMVALLWILRAFTDRFKLEAWLQGSIYVLIMGLIPITMVVVSVSIVAVATRRRPLWFHLCASVAMSLIAPSILAFALTMPRQGRPGQFFPLLFLPPVCAALSMVCVTRALFRLKT
jgi:hypothetical protein